MGAPLKRGEVRLGAFCWPVGAQRPATKKRPVEFSEGRKCGRAHVGWGEMGRASGMEATGLTHPAHFLGSLGEHPLGGARCQTTAREFLIIGPGPCFSGCVHAVWMTHHGNSHSARWAKSAQSNFGPPGGRPLGRGRSSTGRFLIAGRRAGAGPLKAPSRTFDRPMGPPAGHGWWSEL